MANLCNLDGVIVAEADARIPVLDRGFLFGDSVYEVLRTAAGTPFGWQEHFDRLRLSAAALQLTLDLDDRTLARRIADTLAAAGNQDSYVRIVVTRGTGTAPNIDLACATGAPCWVILVRPLTPMSGKPSRLCLIDRLRNDRRALDPATKSGNYLNNVLGLAEAKAQGATDCLMLNAQGHVTEASTSNLFARVDGTWCTPRLEDGILAGITRAMILQVLADDGEEVLERHLTAQDVRSAEELFLSSTLRDIGPVTHLDGMALHGGTGGPATTRLMARFSDYCRERLAAIDGPHWRDTIAR